MIPTHYLRNPRKKNVSSSKWSPNRTFQCEEKEQKEEFESNLRRAKGQGQNRHGGHHPKIWAWKVNSNTKSGTGHRNAGNGNFFGFYYKEKLVEHDAAPWKIRILQECPDPRHGLAMGDSHSEFKGFQGLRRFWVENTNKRWHLFHGDSTVLLYCTRNLQKPWKYEHSYFKLQHRIYFMCFFKPQISKIMNTKFDINREIPKNMCFNLNLFFF